MRIKKDKSSYHSSAIIRRDYRHDPDPVVRKSKSKKDTRKWCRGKVGVKHSYILNAENKFYIFIWKEYTCENCGKREYSSKKVS